MGEQRFVVSMPFVGFADVIVTASNEEEAIEKAFDRGIDLERVGHDVDDHWEYETPRRIVGGNVFYGPLNEIVAEALDDEEQSNG